jgi:Type IV secretion-system coupling protein DNA-binding domain
MAHYTLREKDSEIEKVVLILIFIVAAILIFISLYFNLSIIPFKIPIGTTVVSKLILFKALYILMIFGYSIVYPGNFLRRKLKNANYLFYLIYTFMALLFFLMPIGSERSIFNQIANVLYILSVVALPYFFISTMCLIFNKNTEVENGLDKINTTSMDDFSLVFDTDKGKLVVPNPFQGMMVEGGAGSGKSASIIEPVILQCIEKGFSGFIYDFKGKPPTLGKTAFNGIKQFNTGVEFNIINFSDLKNSHRCNPINPTYLKTASHVEEAAIVLMRNLNPEFISKPDFWARNYQTVLKTLIMFLKQIEQSTGKRVCTLPHLVVLLLEDFNVIKDRINEDDFLRRVGSAVFSLDPEAAKQLAGIKGTIQSAVNRLYTKEIFYLLNPEKGDEVSLDVNNPERPSFLTVCNDPEITDALSPCISLIATRVMKLINQQNKTPSLFAIDELPQLYIPNLHQLPATGRSNKIITLLGLQDYSQLEHLYAKEAEIIVANMGTQFVGMTNNSKSAKRMVDLLGEKRKEEVSRTEGTNSDSESFRMGKDSIVLNSEVSGQKTGHFTGKIANGNPPSFHTQFKLYDKLKVNDPVLLNDTLSDEELQFKIDENWDNIDRDIHEILNSDDISWINND